MAVTERLGQGCKGVITLRVGKDRPGGVRPFCGPPRDSDRTQLAATITIDSRHDGPPTVTIARPDPDASDQPFRPTTLMEEVSKVVEEHGDGPGTNIIHQHVVGKKSKIREAISILVEEGYLRVEPAARNGRSHHSVKPYRQADDSSR